MKLLTIGDTTINLDLVTAIRPALQEPDDLWWSPLPHRAATPSLWSR